MASSAKPISVDVSAPGAPVDAAVPEPLFEDGEAPAWFVHAVAAQGTAVGSPSKAQARLRAVLSADAVGEARTPGTTPRSGAGASAGAAAPSAEAEALAAARVEAAVAVQAAGAALAQAFEGSPAGDGAAGPSGGAVATSASATAKGPGAAKAAASAEPRAPSVCETSRAPLSKFWGGTQAVVAGLAWGAAFSRSVGPVPTAASAGTATGGDVAALWAGALLITAAVGGLLVTTLYFARAIVAFERLKHAVTGTVVVAAAAGASKADGGTAAGGAPAQRKRRWWQRSATAVAHATASGGAARIRAVQISVLLYGDAAAFCCASVWFVVLHKTLPSNVTGPLGWAGPFVWLLITPLIITLAIMATRAYVVRRTEKRLGQAAAKARHNWAFGDTEAMGNAYSGQAEGSAVQAPHALDAYEGGSMATMEANVSMLDFIVTEVEAAGSYMTATSVYSAVVSAQHGALDSGAAVSANTESLEAAWASAAIVTLLVLAGFGLRHCMARKARVRVPAAGGRKGSVITLPSLPAFMVPRQPAREAANRLALGLSKRTGGCCGCADYWAAAGGFWNTWNALIGGSVSMLIVVALSSAMQATVAGAAPTAVGIVGNRAHVETHLVIALSSLAVLALLIVNLRHGLEVCFIAPLRAKVRRAELETEAAEADLRRTTTENLSTPAHGADAKADGPTDAEAAAVAGAVAMLWRHRARRNALAMVLDVRNAYVDTTVSLVNASAAILAGLAVNQVFLDLLDGAVSRSAQAAFSYALCASVAMALAGVFAARGATQAEAARAASGAAGGEAGPSTGGGGDALGAAPAAAPQAMSALSVADIPDIDTARLVLDAVRKQLIAARLQEKVLRARVAAMLQ